MHRIIKEKLPRHIAIIMDGNGRWAKKNLLKRVMGHEKGADSVRTVVKTCRELGIQYLTLFAFSVENWQRPKSEVRALSSLLEEYLRLELQEMKETGIKLITIGDIGRLPKTVRDALSDAMGKTSESRGMVLNLALSYGGRDEIVDAVKRILRDSKSTDIDENTITKDFFSGYLHTANIPDPDLLIRTSGEYRLSNFLLWQLAYAELYFTDVLWPDFSRDDLIKAIVDYQRRERRFGLISE
ncbi:MAG: isoprenyl transferase [Deltaproteobacteria bacterium]|nr:isoprenyl transferase [Deltaproteobacteria bacterium]MBW2649103.1 isoprenyl transferase [Deltaproteobacteria bacterium]